MKLDEYRTRYSGIRFAREGGVLEMTLHTRGGEAKWGTARDSLHAELGEAFADLARDLETRVVLLTGTGDRFIAEMDHEARFEEPDLAAMWERIYAEAVALIDNLLTIPVPVIAAVNGPALIHAELALLSDIVLAAEHAEFADLAHIAGGGAVPGDGVQTVWPLLLGPNRGRYFLLTGQRIGAAEALRLGLVGEVLPRDALLPRARELAHGLAALPARTLRHTRAVLTRHLRARLRDELGFGLAVEALAMLTGDPATRPG